MIFPYCSQKVLNGPLSNCVSLSDINTRGIPKQVMMFFHKNLLELASVMCTNGFASIHLVKKSMATMSHWRFPGALGRGPTISSPHCENGHGLAIGLRLAAG